jgi:putative photosynthetic complex assembly protein
MTLAPSPTPRNANLIPTPVVIAAASLMVFAIVIAGLGRVTGFGRVETAASSPYWTLQLRFEDRPDGSIAVRDAERGDVFSVVAPGTGGFVRATMRTFAQARKNDDLGAEVPFKLVRWRDGAITLNDPATGRSVELDAFGVDNAGAFAKMFAEREASR